MDQTGAMLALIGIAVGLVLLGFLVALVPLRTFVQRRWRFFFGPYPQLMIYTWVDKIGLIEDRKQAVSFSTACVRRVPPESWNFTVRGSRRTARNLS